MGRAVGNTDELEAGTALGRRRAESESAWPECAICGVEVTDEGRTMHPVQFGHIFRAVGSSPRLEPTAEEIEEYQRRGRTVRIDCRCGRIEYVSPRRFENLSDHELQKGLCIECLRATGWSIPQGNGYRPEISYDIRDVLPREHREPLESLHRRFNYNPTARVVGQWSIFNEYHGLDEALRAVKSNRALGLEGDDREELYRRGADPRTLEQTSRYLVLPLGPADKGGFATFVLARNTTPDASTEWVVEDVVDGLPAA